MAKRKVRIEQPEIVRRFATRLREIRLARGLTQADLAHRAVITPTYIARLESGRVAPGIDLVDRLAKAMGSSITDLLPTTEPPDVLPVLRDRVEKLTATLRAADRDTLLMVVPLLARLLESPTRSRG